MKYNSFAFSCYFLQLNPVRSCFSIPSWHLNRCKPFGHFSVIWSSSRWARLTPQSLVTFRLSYPLALRTTQALAWRTFSNDGGLPVLSHHLPFLLVLLPLVCWASPRYLAASLFFLPPLMSRSHLCAAGFSLPSSQSSCIRCWLDDSHPSTFHGVYRTLGHLLILTLVNVGIQNKCGCISEMTSLSDSFFSSLKWSQVAYKQVYQQKRSQEEAILWSVHLTFWGWWWCWGDGQWFTNCRTLLYHDFSSILSSLNPLPPHSRQLL